MTLYGMMEIFHHHRPELQQLQLKNGGGAGFMLHHAPPHFIPRPAAAVISRPPPQIMAAAVAAAAAAQPPPAHQNHMHGQQGLLRIDDNSKSALSSPPHHRQPHSPNNHHQQHQQQPPPAHEKPSTSFLISDILNGRIGGSGPTGNNSSHSNNNNKSTLGGDDNDNIKNDSRSNSKRSTKKDRYLKSPVGLFGLGFNHPHHHPHHQNNQHHPHNLNHLNLNHHNNGYIGGHHSPRMVVRPWDAISSHSSSSGVGGGSDGEGEDEEIDVGEEKPKPLAGTKASPLDALFKMTNKTFNEVSSTGLLGTDGEGRDQMSGLFSKSQPSKKRRKSRTAFSNHQIYELEKRFLYQKYLTPADRDEIAQQLALTNAQVITWFQNRRAKLKRDLEELKQDMSAAKVLGKEPPTMMTRLEEMQAYTTRQSLLKWEKRTLKLAAGGGKCPTGFNPLSLLDEHHNDQINSPDRISDDVSDLEHEMSLNETPEKLQRLSPLTETNEQSHEQNHHPDDENSKFTDHVTTDHDHVTDHVMEERPRSISPGRCDDRNAIHDDHSKSPG